VTENEQNTIFDAWIQQHKGLIFKALRAYTINKAEAEDLFQEIAIQIWRSVPSFRGEASVTTWLYRITLNTAIKWKQKERKHNQSESLDSTHHILEEQKAQPDERLTWLYEEIHKLDTIDRSITLLFLEGFSYKEMAAMLGITESNVGVKINRIKKQLITKSKQHHGNGI